MQGIIRIKGETPTRGETEEGKNEEEERRMKKRGMRK